MTDIEAEAAYWGIPTLDARLQLTELVPPVYPYGTVPRTRKVGGTVHCYVDDGKFTRLFANPARILLTGCEGVFEPNCSTGPGVPRACAVFGIYRKRAAASYWQSLGLNICVDLNVYDRDLDLALLGVPRGWASYATRTHRGNTTADPERRWEMAKKHAGTDSVFFAVVGGGKAVKDACLRHGWHYVPEHFRVVMGEEPEYGRPQ